MILFIFFLDKINKEWFFDSPDNISANSIDIFVLLKSSNDWKLTNKIIYFVFDRHSFYKERKIVFFYLQIIDEFSQLKVFYL